MLFLAARSTKSDFIESIIYLPLLLPANLRAGFDSGFSAGLVDTDPEQSYTRKYEQQS
jgi:hypothetical protein